MISPINNQNANDFMANIYKNKPVQNDEANVNSNEKSAETKKPAANNVQATGNNTQENSTSGKTVDILA